MVEQKERDGVTKILELKGGASRKVGIEALRRVTHSSCLCQEKLEAVAVFYIWKEAEKTWKQK